jgi:hypothetical protein
MVRTFLPLGLLLLLLTSGCGSDLVHDFIGENPNTTLVPPRVGDHNPPPMEPPPTHRSYAPASGETNLTVDVIGQKILDANRQAGLRPVFITIGTSVPEVFHRGTTELYITEGMVKQCPADGQLAAVLCNELGKMVAEREALAGPQIRNPERRLPINVPWGNSGQIDAADQVRLAEEEKFDRERRRPTLPLPPPDPSMLARLYLKNANYPETDLETVAPLLQAAQKNCDLEQQIKRAPQK